MKKFILIGLLTSCFVFVRAQKDSLSEYTGTYKFPEGNVVPTVDITVQDQALFVTSNMGSAAMPHVSKDTFSIPEYYNAVVYFIRDQQGKVVKIHIEANGTTVEGQRQGGSIAFAKPRRRYTSGSK